MIIVSTNSSGLSNRIKSFVSCVKIGIENNYTFKIKWDILDDYNKDTHILNCSFDKLFSNDIEISEIKKEFQIYNHHCLYVNDNDNINDNFNNFDPKIKKKFRLNDKKKRNIDFMYNKIPDNVKQNYIKYFKILELNSELKSKVDEFSKNFNEKTISIHIRSWNRNGEKSRQDVLFNLQKFINEINKYPDNNYFLSSDSQEVIDKLKEEFNDKLLTYPRKTKLDTSRDFPEGIQEDLIELYLLSKNKFIIGSHGSTFTEVAWWLAECPKNIIIC